jgi:hypothetical protein
LVNDVPSMEGAMAPSMGMVNGMHPTTSAYYARRQLGQMECHIEPKTTAGIVVYVLPAAPTRTRFDVPRPRDTAITG